MARMREKGNSLFEKCYITLDDSAQFGFNIAEAEELKSLVNDLHLNDRVLIYPGADEVPLALLYKVVVDHSQKTPKLKLIYRNESSIDLIPNYEGDPLSHSLVNQIKAAGAEIVQNGEITLLVNNFDGPSQISASKQSSDSPTDFSKFNSTICS